MQNKNTDISKNKTLGYRLGQAFAVVVSSCFMAIIIALTAKLIGWMLF